MPRPPISFILGALTGSDQALDPEPEALREELSLLSEALRSHLDYMALSGASGTPRAAAANAASPQPRVATGAKTSSAPDAAAPTAAAPGPSGLSAAPPGVGWAGGSPSEGRARLAVLQAEAQACMRCGLHSARTQSVFSRGNGASGLVFVGEGPGEEEDRQGLPFVGAAGQLLDKMIAAMQLDREEVYVCNIVKCRPPRNRKPEPAEMAACLPFLTEQLEILSPRVIVALGATAVQGLFGTTEGITRLRGQWKLYRGKIPVMPTFHPAYLLRQPQAKREVWRDLQEVLRQLGQPPH